jgi:hypothetical protein
MQEIVIEEMRLVLANQCEQHVLDGCALRVRATIAEVFGYERAMSEVVTTDLVSSAGCRYARAYVEVDRDEIVSAGLEVKG